MSIYVCICQYMHTSMSVFVYFNVMSLYVGVDVSVLVYVCLYANGQYMCMSIYKRVTVSKCMYINFFHVGEIERVVWCTGAGASPTAFRHHRLVKSPQKGRREGRESIVMERNLW